MTMMKRCTYFRLLSALVPMAVAVVLMTACATTAETRERRAAEQQRIAQAVEDIVASGDFTVEMNYVNPQRMRSKMLTGEYGVTVKGDSIDSYLPFFGRVYRAEFGIQTGLRFEDKIAQRQVKRARKDYYEVDLVVKRHMEHLFYSFDIYDNGKVTLMVRSDNRDTMHFSGDLVIE